MKILTLIFLTIPIFPFLNTRIKNYFTAAKYSIATMIFGGLIQSWMLLKFSWEISLFTSIIGEIAILTYFLVSKKNADELKMAKFKFPKSQYLYFLTFLWGIFSIYYQYKTIVSGEWTWDAANVHQPIVLSIFQEQSIRNLPNVSPWQALPSAPHLYIANWLQISSAVKITQVALAPFLVLFIYICLCWIHELFLDKKITKQIQNFLFTATLISPPLFLSFGATYIDFYSQVILLIVVKSSYDIFLRKNISIMDMLLVGIFTAGIITSKLSTTYQVMVLIIFLLYQISKMKLSILYRLKAFFIFSIISSLGLVFFLRNWLDYKNPFYPYYDVFGSNFKNGLFTSNEMHGFLVGAASPMVASAGLIYSVFWTQIGSIFVWIDQHFNVLQSLLSGNNPVTYQTFDAGSVYALDARVVGNGILMHIAFLVITVILIYAISKGIRKSEITFLCVILAMLLAVPGPTTGRYNWACTYSFVIIGTLLLNQQVYSRNYQKVLLMLSLITIVGTLSFANFYVNESKPYSEQTKPHFETGAIFSILENNTEISGLKCGKIRVLRNLQSQNTFASGFWLGGTCSQVKQYKSVKDSDLIAVIASSQNEQTQRCINSLPSLKLVLVDRWGQSSIYFIKSTDMSNEILRFCEIP